MSSNLLRTLRGDEFTEAKHLTKLTLSFNEIAVENKPLVQGPDLIELYLVSCGLASFHDRTFENLTELQFLHLEENPIDSVSKRLAEC